MLDDAIKTPKTPKTLLIEARLHREITGTLKSITLSRSATGKYYASLLCNDGIEMPAKPALISNVTGLDMGLMHFAIKSDGIKIANPRHLNNASYKSRRKQKVLSRKKKGSANRRKARIQLAAVHERGANARADFQHKLSRAIVDEIPGGNCRDAKSGEHDEKSQTGAFHRGCWLGLSRNWSTKPQKQVFIW